MTKFKRGDRVDVSYLWTGSVLGPAIVLCGNVEDADGFSWVMVQYSNTISRNGPVTVTSVEAVPSKFVTLREAL